MQESESLTREEEHWINTFARNMDAETAEKSRQIILEARDLIVEAAKVDTRLRDSPALHESQTRLIHGLQQRGDYLDILGTLKKDSKGTAPLFSPRQRTAIIIALCLKGLEGGLKHRLRLLWWAAEVVAQAERRDKDDGLPAFDPDWDAKGKQFLSDAMNGLCSVLPEGNQIRATIEESREESGAFLLNRIRRSIAHSDYEVREDEGEVEILLVDGKQELPISLENMLAITRMVLDTSFHFDVAVHLALARVNGEKPWLPAGWDRDFG